MTSESKILTVSYGTFSCTLEGFDDPFNAMKAIAEYFRDLAADDRYFGAEPPQPDAAMLHRIAEREVSRLVDTRVRDNGVYLRPQEAAVAEATARDARRGAHDGDTGTSEPDLAEPDQPEPALADPDVKDDIPGGVAARLARIRQSVTPASIISPLPEEEMEPAEDDDIAASSVSDDALEVYVLEEYALEYSALGEVGDDTDAPALDVAGRIGAMIQAPDEPAAEAEEFLLDDLVEQDANDLETEAEDAAPFVALSEDEDDLPAEAALTAEADLVDSAANGDLSALAGAQGEDDDMLGDALETGGEAAVDAAGDDNGLPADAGLAAELAHADSLPEDAPDTPSSLEDAQRADPVPELSTAAEVVPEEPSLPVEASDKESGRSRRVSSRVVRLHAGDDGAPNGDKGDPNSTRILNYSGEDAEVSRLLRQADDVMADVENRRRLDSIAHLKAAVAATEADRAVTGDSKPSQGAKEGTKLDPYRDDLAHVVQPDPEPAPGSEVRPRRNTVSVRPQEPRPGTIRPGMVSPPPLVLVSEQRIDRVAPPATQPSRDGQPKVALRTGRLTGAIGVGAASAPPSTPQRKLVLEKTSGASLDQDDDEDQDEDLTEVDEAGLASFAERVGVKSMADMLEAAAAYATCIERRTQFTRPQLMRRLIASAANRPISREDGLRSFGTLLRTGRIEKVSRGHYCLAETSPYLAEARRFS